jgi:hypothetical protein
MDRDMLWRWDKVLKTHPNGMRFSVFDKNGDLLATNEYFRYSVMTTCHELWLAHGVLWLIRQSSVGGGFVVNDKTKGASGQQELLVILILGSAS